MITGGKFANGAITAAFANLYNKWQDYAWAGAEVAASTIPGVGEAQDISVILGSGYAWWERGLAGLSLAANVLTAGYLPNAGGLIRGAEHLADDGVIYVTKAGVALPADAK